jgi:hypothetical protein
MLLYVLSFQFIFLFEFTEASSYAISWADRQISFSELQWLVLNWLLLAVNCSHKTWASGVWELHEEASRELGEFAGCHQGKAVAAGATAISLKDPLESYRVTWWITTAKQISTSVALKSTWKRYVLFYINTGTPNYWWALSAKSLNP